MNIVDRTQLNVSSATINCMSTSGRHYAYKAAYLIKIKTMLTACESDRDAENKSS